MGHYEVEVPVVSNYVVSNYVVTYYTAGANLHGQKHDLPIFAGDKNQHGEAK